MIPVKSHPGPIVVISGGAGAAGNLRCASISCIRSALERAVPQLLLPMAIAGGGSFTSVKISGHTRTAASLIEQFTGRGIRFGVDVQKRRLVKVG